MDELYSKVYVQLDEQNRIVRCEGGYTTPPDLTGWTYIDEGSGDCYNLCQSHYFVGGLYTEDGVCRWKYADGVCVLRTAEEIEADRQAQPEPEPTPQEDADAMLVDHELRIIMIELGVSE